MTFEEFKNSFNYGDRSDLNFKFLAHLSEIQAATFFQELLQRMGETINDGNVQRLTSLICHWQAQGYAQQKNFEYANGPFAPLDRSVRLAHLGLLTSSGHFVYGDDPQPLGEANMTQQQAEDRIKDFLKEAPQLSTIPWDTSADRLVVRHGGYDISGSVTDANVSFPLRLLRQLNTDGHIGKLASEAYSFVGTCSQTRLLKHSGPEWVMRLIAQGVHAMLLVPV